MTIFDLLLSLAGRGVVLTPRDGQLLVDAPVGVLNGEDRALLVQHKGELLALLAAATTPDDLPPDWRAAWEERAVIMECDGKLPRPQAESLALIDVLGIKRRVESAAAANLDSLVSKQDNQ
jgi:hypothetical protein